MRELLDRLRFALPASEEGQSPASLRPVSDSRKIQAGDLFVAFPGARSDGREHIASAIAAGAAAVVWEQDGFTWSNDWQVPNVAVQNLQAQLGELASAYCENPSSQLRVIAVTGTSGKTSCSSWIAQVTAALEFRSSGLIGTRGSFAVSPAGLTESVGDFGLTTPQAIEMQEVLAALSNVPAVDVAMEASSIGLVQGRLNGMQIHTAIFTNLSRDHLDYHLTMEAYAQAKASLFAWPGLRSAVINVDDPAAQQMVASFLGAGHQAAELILVSTLKGTTQTAIKAHWAEVLAANAQTTVRWLFAENIDLTPPSGGSSFNLTGDFGRALVSLQLPGHFNIQNALCVAAAALNVGHSIHAVASQLALLQPVEGRMQKVASAPLVIVDYAHKPDALQQVLESLAEQARAREGELYCVFGCGGNRDPGKRPIMGAIAAKLADHLVVTSDNPRDEDPQAIIDQILAGIDAQPESDLKAQTVVQPQRAEAIHWTLATAKASDVVLIAGKGHEDYQEIKGVKYPFSDALVAAEALNAHRIEVAA